MALEAYSVKLTPEVKAQLIAAQENSEAMTGNAFFELLLEAFLNPKTRPVEVQRPSAAQLEEIQLKDNEIGRLKTTIDFQNETIEQAKTDIDTILEEKQSLNQLIEKLQNMIPVDAYVGIKDNQILIDVNPFINFCIDDEIAAAAKKGREMSRADIIIESFLRCKKLSVVHPFRIWNESEFKSNQAKFLKPAE